MKIRIISGLLIITISIICSSITCIGLEEKQNVDYNFSNELKEKFEIIKYIRSDTLWFPGFFITLLLAPFIILYLIIAIILEIGNP
jgi:hypothetical protein